MKKYEIIREAKYIKLADRDILSISPKALFGLEIEMDHLSKRKQSKIKLLDKYETKEDSTLKVGGIELITEPLTNSDRTVRDLKELSNFLTKLNPSFEYSSFQVNLNIDLTDEEIISFLKLFAYYEDIILSYSKGDAMTLRYNQCVYAMGIKELVIAPPMDLIRLFTDSKAHGIALKKIKSRNINAIEFRTPNGTTNSNLWFDYITLFQSLIDYVSRCDKEEIDYKFEHINEGYYSLDRVIELSKLLPNEEEQLRFLKHYSKNNVIKTMILR